jgi:hypothetical protein
VESRVRICKFNQLAGKDDAVNVFTRRLLPADRQLVIAGKGR